VTQISWEYYDKPGERGIRDYLKFFDRLTHVVVLKTLGINGEDSMKAFDFPKELSLFLSTGKIS